jgi:hypothetical protein
MPFPSTPISDFARLLLLQSCLFVADVEGFFSFLRITNELRSLVPEICEAVARFNAFVYNPRIWDFETASFVMSNKI